MTSDEFRVLLSRDRDAAIFEYVQTWVDANNESDEDLVSSLAALVSHDGVPRLVLGTDEEMAEDYDVMVDNPVDGDDEDDDDNGD